MKNALKVKLKDAEKKKRELIKKKILDFSYNFKKEKGFIYFPVKKLGNSTKKFEKREQKTLNSLLSKYLNKKEISMFPSSFDFVGDILIIELPKTLIKKEKQIGRAILKFFKHVKVVARKSGIHGGEFRTRKLKIIAGENRKETLYKENDVLIKLNVETCYFSARLSNERLRIAKKVKRGEEVLVMFSGVAPYPLVISKNSNARLIYGIEINPKANKFARENLVLNKIGNVVLLEGDVKRKMKSLNKKFDRVIMPLPKNAKSFLDVALNHLKKGGVIHFYDFSKEEDIPKKSVEKIKKHCNPKIIKVVKCGQYAPKKFRVCIDFKVK